MTITGPRQATRATRATWAAWSSWALTGAIGALSIVGMWTIGTFIAPIAAALLVIMVVRHADASVWGVLAGPGAMSLWLGWANRLGPGEHCTEIPNGIRCEQTLWEPVPFVVVALVLIGAAIAGFLLARRSRSSPRGT